MLPAVLAPSLVLCLLVDWWIMLVGLVVYSGLWTCVCVYEVVHGWLDRVLYFLAGCLLYPVIMGLFWEKLLSQRMRLRWLSHYDHDLVVVVQLWIIAFVTVVLLGLMISYLTRRYVKQPRSVKPSEERSRWAIVGRLMVFYGLSWGPLLCLIRTFEIERTWASKFIVTFLYYPHYLLTHVFPPYAYYTGWWWSLAVR
ncbi:MAG: hypothetical protein JSU94_01850 [Phycisphaerales bacterium]|nr:MAG: hypothetical protein JSU94_01850 [Phycisphaerales bacterium]